MTLPEFIGNHPYLTVICLAITANALGEFLKAAVGCFESALKEALRSHRRANCKACGGTGELVLTLQSGSSPSRISFPCAECGGSRAVDSEAKGNGTETPT